MSILTELILEGRIYSSLSVIVGNTMGGNKSFSLFWVSGRLWEAWVNLGRLWETLGDSGEAFGEALGGFGELWETLGESLGGIGEALGAFQSLSSPRAFFLPYI